MEPVCGSSTSETSCAGAASCKTIRYVCILVRTYTPVLESTALALLLSVSLEPNSTSEACKD